jgi:arylsulfatase A-like enzyme
MTETNDDSRPNVLVVLTDQQRWDTVGAYGSPMDLTPNLDAMAERGTRLERTFTSQPLCGPSRACLQTGQYGTTSGVWKNARPLPDGDHLLAREFARNGYDTHYVGKWHLAGTKEDPVPEGQRGGYEDRWIAADVPEFTSHPTEGLLYDEDGDPVEFDEYRVDAYTDHAISVLEDARDAEDPFFCFLSYLEPHHQNDMETFVAPEGYAERYAENPHIPHDLRDRPGDWYEELPDYYGICKRIDECLGRLLGALERTGQAEDTIVLFTSDHGCHFWTRPGEYKRSAHESSIRVPAVLQGPGFDGGDTVEELVSLLDVPPTLLDAAGLDVPETMEGRSLVPLTDGEDVDWREEVFVQISESEIGRAIRTDRWKYAVAAPTVDGWEGGMDDPASDLYVERYLYDLASDPNERINLVGRPEYQETLDELRGRLLERIAEVEDERPEIRPYQNPGYRTY